MLGILSRIEIRFLCGFHSFSLCTSLKTDDISTNKLQKRNSLKLIIYSFFATLTTNIQIFEVVSFGGAQKQYARCDIAEVSVYVSLLAYSLMDGWNCLIYT